MDGAKKTSDFVWVISRAKYLESDIKSIGGHEVTGPILEYKISDLARYMLKPDPIQVSKKLIGCEIYYRKPFHGRFRDVFKKMTPHWISRKIKDGSLPPQIIMASDTEKAASLQDKNLDAHVKTIYRQLRPYSSFSKKLDQIDMEKVVDIVGVCQEMSSDPTPLSLQGELKEKLYYIRNFILEDVGVFLQKPLVSEGYFEMRGFDFKSYDPERQFRLLKFHEKNRVRILVLDQDNKIDFELEDARIIHDMHMLEHSIQSNTNFSQSLHSCVKGETKPVTLLFNRELEVHYSNTYIPQTYREVFEYLDMQAREREMALNSLRDRQIGVLFNCVPDSESVEQKVVSHVSVIHDFQDLMPLKDNLPNFYSEINRRASFSETGRFYLLDTMEGPRDAK